MNSHIHSFAGQSLNSKLLWMALTKPYKKLTPVPEQPAFTPADCLALHLC